MRTRNQSQSLRDFRGTHFLPRAKRASKTSFTLRTQSTLKAKVSYIQNTVFTEAKSILKRVSYAVKMERKTYLFFQKDMTLKNLNLR